MQLQVVYDAESGLLRWCTPEIVISSLDANNTNNFVLSIKTGEVKKVESRDHFISIRNSAIIIVFCIGGGYPDGSVLLEENVGEDAIKENKLLVLDYLRKAKKKNEGVDKNKDNFEQVAERLKHIETERFIHIDEEINIIEGVNCTKMSLLKEIVKKKQLVQSDKDCLENLKITLANLMVRREKNNELVQQNRNFGFPEDHQDVIRALVEHMLIEISLCRLSKDSKDLSCSTNLMAVELTTMIKKLLLLKFSSF
ncbi:uncharacterized protein LOC117106754 isoform X2 [Anneissia japonica]|nr:uncharacterized protein LOC117106754 isoform X2 [Anneissia japonica]XP_033104068.1 uncharacterized protein LOC117106754 isoform X2 [Anneissia japonica]XP_033104069.1 uncharacterized protein LOC117106754 isoform X2 [Anneissia japonica]